MGDAQQPGDKGGATLLVASYSLPGLEKGLSGQVFGLARVVDQVVDVAVHADDVPVVELRKGVAVSIDCPLD